MYLTFCCCFSWLPENQLLGWKAIHSQHLVTTKQRVIHSYQLQMVEDRGMASNSWTNGHSDHLSWLREAWASTTNSLIVGDARSGLIFAVTVHNDVLHGQTINGWWLVDPPPWSSIHISSHHNSWRPSPMMLMLLVDHGHDRPKCHGSWPYCWLNHDHGHDHSLSCLMVHGLSPQYAADVNDQVVGVDELNIIIMFTKHPHDYSINNC